MLINVKIMSIVVIIADRKDKPSRASFVFVHHHCCTFSRWMGEFEEDLKSAVEVSVVVSHGVRLNVVLQLDLETLL